MEIGATKAVQEELFKQLFGHKKLVCNDEKQDI